MSVRALNLHVSTEKPMAKVRYSIQSQTPVYQSQFSNKMDYAVNIVENTVSRTNAFRIFSCSFFILYIDISILS